MLWSIDSCQNMVSVDHYHLNVPQAQVPTHRGRVVFWSYSLTNYQFQTIGGSSLFFPMIHIKYVVFISLWPPTIRILISNWSRTEKFNQFFKKYRRGTPFLTTVTRWSRCTSNFYTLIGQNLTGDFMPKIYAASWKLFTLTAEADRVLCQLVMLIFNCRLPLDVQNKIQLLSRVSCYSWLVCLLGFWLRNASLVKIR